ncbi:MAG TPA: sugar ABC transporter ATP-binding protein [Candidatus Blautia intestinavium]|nr:sugar ABC transporter ATP-binding protein [Candidatus Blautia intestinavium]
MKKESDKNTQNPILQISHITKTFPGVKALTDVSIDFYPGEVHALLGENGAGKSTLIKIVSGVYTPTDGKMIFDGQERSYKNPGEALNAGISVIHQELSIANDLSVAENIFVGREPVRGKNKFLLDRRKMEADAQEALDFMKVNFKATDIAGELSAAQQQMIEIAKVITRNSKMVIMDEPTSSLSESEIEALFYQIKLLKEKNVAIIYITHRLKELQEIVDRVTILRDGEVVKKSLFKDITEAEIVTNMVGREITNYYNKQEHHRQEEMLRVEGLSSGNVFSDISFSAYKGEILGFAGLVGAGRTEVMETIFGYRKKTEGKVFVKGKEVNINNPREAIMHKIGFVTEDRRRTGLMLEASVRSNIVLPSVKRMAKNNCFVDFKWEKDVCKEYFLKLQIKAPSGETIIKNLSGGNQQKVILAKWLVAQSEILLLDEPTRGIDVNAKAEFYGLMNEFVKEGGCIVMVSSELPEILGVADRVIVMREGHVSGEIDDKEEMTEYSIMQLASVHSGA